MSNRKPATGFRLNRNLQELVIEHCGGVVRKHKMEVIAIRNPIYNNNNQREFYFEETNEEDLILEALTKRLEEELKVAKRRLSVGEVLLPNGLTRVIVKDMLSKADEELCGLRGCTLTINFQGEVSKQLLNIKFDKTTPSTFELILTLKQATTGWNAFLPQFLKKIARGGTIMVSPEYRLEKKKLYSFFSD